MGISSKAMSVINNFVNMSDCMPVSVAQWANVLSEPHCLLGLTG